MFPADLKYMKSHEWARREDDIADIGVSDYAQAEIQDVVYVELPEVGTILEQHKTFGVIESVKAAFDLYSPVSGEVVEINEELEDTPELVNEAPYDGGWMVKIRISDPSELEGLMSASEYQATIEAEENE
jgi:glycine cleavage system H protein